MDYHKTNFSQEHTRSYDIRYVAEIKHTGLNEFRILKDLDEDILDKKVEMQFNKWDAKFETLQKKKEKFQQQQEAIEKTKEAKTALIEIENILLFTLDIDDTIDWAILKRHDKYEKQNPKNNLTKKLSELQVPEEPEYKTIPREPTDLDIEYIPKFTILESIFASLKDKKVTKLKDKFKSAHLSWQEGKVKIETSNEKMQTDFTRKQKNYEIKYEQLIQKYHDLEIQWEKDKEKFNEKQKKYNKKIDTLKTDYFNGSKIAIEQYCELVLNNSQYPATFPKDFEIEYNSNNRILIIEFVLPSPEKIPTLSEMKYIASRNEFSEVHISEGQLNRVYDTTIYNITLRTIHEIFEADSANAIDAVNFNGWVNFLNKATGKNETSCIVSIQARKSEFLEINLAKVDTKACFKTLKGVGSSKLYGITAIQPILQIDKDDKRIVNSRNVEYDASTNLAAMDWEDFEHLIRELFEKEFTVNGGEVKVTQASRDGGVDAIAFDPDPIRGGKIVIQAKRYTNVVGVSAVRDLFGTVMNEGATKGILVTTADYGSDSYEFAKGKPLTLLNGSNLLHLLEKHGQKARIDINEARKIMNLK